MLSVDSKEVTVHAHNRALTRQVNALVPHCTHTLEQRLKRKRSRSRLHSYSVIVESPNAIVQREFTSFELKSIRSWMSILVFLFIVFLRCRFQLYELRKNRDTPTLIIHSNSLEAKFAS